MESLFEEGREERNIEDYLFGSHNMDAPKTGQEKDEQFARPIEDEDLFGFNEKPSEETVESIPEPVLSKKEQLRLKLLEQVRALSCKPKKLGSGFGPDGTIELFVDESTQKSSSDSKFIFNKLIERAKKNANSIETMRGSSETKWQIYKDQLRKKICEQKRKVWDSFQAPIDNYDEEEEIIDYEDLRESRSHSDDHYSNEDAQSNKSESDAADTEDAEEHAKDDVDSDEAEDDEIEEDVGVEEFDEEGERELDEEEIESEIERDACEEVEKRMTNETVDEDISPEEDLVSAKVDEETHNHTTQRSKRRKVILDDSDEED